MIMGLMYLGDWITEINFDDLPEELQQIVLTAEEHLGRHALDRATAVRYAIMIAEEFGGMHYPLPKIDKVLSSIRVPKGAFSLDFSSRGKNGGKYTNRR